MGERFANLCLDDKLRLQSLIRELSKTTEEVNNKQRHISQLEQKLKNEIQQKTSLNKEKEAALQKIKFSEKKFEEYQKSLQSKQNEISMQISEAKERIEKIKAQRK